MRRSPAVLLILALLSPVLLALGGTSAEGSALPACCRKAGMHHCVQTFVSSSSPTLTSAPCPLYPSAAAVPAVQALAFTSAPPITFSLPVRCGVALTPMQDACHPAARGASLRGPPIARTA